LITLLALSGIEQKVKSTSLAEWTVITQGIKWEPELRYQKMGSYSRIDAANMLNAVKTLMKIL